MNILMSCNGPILFLYRGTREEGADKKGKPKKVRNNVLKILAPDLVETDPLVSGSIVLYDIGKAFN